MLEMVGDTAVFSRVSVRFLFVDRHSAQVPEPQEQIVTPFAQILHTLHNVHKNYMLLTNVNSNRSIVTAIQLD